MQPVHHFLPLPHGHLTPPGRPLIPRRRLVFFNASTLPFSTDLSPFRPSRRP